jgi:hypothetical protein
MRVTSTCSRKPTTTHPAGCFSIIAFPVQSDTPLLFAAYRHKRYNLTEVIINT